MAIDAVDILDEDNFFYYGESGKEFTRDEVLHDIAVGVNQEQDALFFFRQEGTFVSKKKNYPNTLIQQIMLRYSITNWVSFRNTYISDGKNESTDRRAATSQTVIQFVRSEDPADPVLTANVLVILFSDFELPVNLNVPLELNI